MNQSIIDTVENSRFFSFVDYSVFGILLAFSLAIGLYFGFFTNDKQTTEEYLLGGHKMKTIPIAISLVASQLSAIAIMAIPAEVYSFGWQYGLLIPTLILITLSCNYIFIPVFYHNNIDNCYAYLELRFSKTVRVIVTTSFLFTALFFLPVILYIPSLAFTGVTGHNIHVVNSIVCSICVLYTMLGGIKAVVWTDVLQAGVMVASVVLVAIYGVQKVGGIAEVWHRSVAGGRITVPDFSIDLTVRQTFWNIVFGMFIMWTCHIGFNQSCVQRIVSLPSLAHSRKSLFIFGIGVMFIMTFNIMTGVIMYAYYYDCDPVKENIVSKYDQIMPRFVQDVAGDIAGMPGVFISCVFSASLSTVSATLNSIAGILYSDFIRPLKLFRHNDVNANFTMKLTVLTIGIVCAMGGFIVEHFKSIFQVVNTVAGVCTGAVFGVFTLGMLYPWANKTGALWGTLISMGTVLCVIINTQTAIRNGLLAYDIIPTSVEGCKEATMLKAIYNNDTITKSLPNGENGGFEFYKIAFLWYGPIGVLTMWTSAIIISHLTGGQDLTKFNLDLLAPCVQYMLPKKYKQLELQVLSKPVSASDNKEKIKADESEWVLKNDEKSQQITNK